MWAFGSRLCGLVAVGFLHHNLISDVMIKKSDYDIKPTATSPYECGPKAHINWTCGQAKCAADNSTASKTSQYDLLHF